MRFYFYLSLSVALVFCAQIPIRAQTCPAIRFATTPALLPPDQNTVLILVRQADGSFTEYGTGGATPSFVTPNIQNSFNACYPPPTPKGPRARIDFHPTGTGSQPGALVDLNGNGVPESIVAETGPGITIYYDFNDANPTHLLPQVTPGGVSVGDVNGDGSPDLVVLDQGNGTTNPGGVYVLTNDGKGNFLPSAHLDATSPNSVAIADVNGDGKMDLVVGTFAFGATGNTGGVSIYLGNGDGTFQAPASAYSGGPVISVNVADFNGDGKLDIAAAGYGGSSTRPNPITVLLGDGRGGFTAGQPFSSGGDANYLVSGDFNGDGKLDIACGNNRDQTVTILLGKGDGTFQAPYGYIAPYGPTELTVTDFNNDGIADILIGVSNPSVIGESENSLEIGVLIGNGDGTFQGGQSTPVSNDTATFLAAADFNGDGKLDVAVGVSSGTLALFAGKGDGTFEAPVLSPASAGGPGVSGDFNGDGRPDLAVAQAFSSGINILLNSGSGTFQSPISIQNGGGTPAGIVTADFNGDGKLDLAITNQGSQFGSSGQAANLTVLNGSGTGSFAVASTYPAGTSPTGIATADLNGDGKPDVVVTDQGAHPATPGAVYVFLNQGNGTFRPGVQYPAGSFPTFVAIGDVNGDNKPDLVVATSDANVNFQLAVLLGNGDGTFQAPTLIPTDFGPNWIAIQDFNGDGKPDLVVAHCCGDTDVTYLLGHGDGTFDPEVHFNGGGSPAILTAADINGDGKPDLLIAGDMPAAFTPLLNISSAAASPSLAIASSTPGPAGSPVAADSIASAYGTDLANQTLSASSLGTNLGGTTVNVTDSAGAARAASLFFVSRGQVNFLIPAGTANGTATVTVQSGDGSSSTAMVQIVDVAPGLYTLNANGLVAANVLYVAPDGTQTFDSVYQLSGNQVIAKPVSLDPATDQVYLILYGTGFRHAPTSAFSATVGGTPVQVLYGVASGSAGEDQMAIALPYSLKGKGDVQILVTVAGQAANPVRVTVQ